VTVTSPPCSVLESTWRITRSRSPTQGIRARCLIENGRARLIDTKPGLPVGVRPAGEYLTTMIRAAPGSTLLAFTDGLYERRDEPVDAGLERVRLAVTDRPLTLEELLDDLLAKTGSGMDDDTALLGMQWTT
jgi:hypothetical protein